MRGALLSSISLLVVSAGLAQGQATEAKPAVQAPVQVPVQGGIPTGTAPTAQPVPAGTAVPKMTADASVELGTISDEKSIEKTIRFTNTGDAPLEILGVRGSCGCTVPSLDKLEKRVYAPGEGGSFPVTYNPANRNGPQTTTVFIRTNDPTVPETQVQIKSVVKPLVSIEPKAVMLGSIAREQGATGTVTITSLLPDLKIEQAITNNPLIKAEILETKDVVVNNETTKQTQIRITVPPNMPVGMLNDAVTIRTSDAARTLYSGVSGEVQGAFVTTPTVLTFPRMTASQDIRTQIRVVSRNAQPFKITGVSDSPTAGAANFKFDVQPDPQAQPENSAFLIRIAGTGPAEGALQGTLTINTDSATDPAISVRYTGIVTAAPKAAQPAARDPWKDQPSTLIPNGR